MENLDETHFTIKFMDNGVILGFWDDVSIRYANIVGGEKP